MLLRSSTIIFFLALSISALQAQNFLKTQEAADAKNWSQAYTEFMKLEAKDKKGKLLKKADGNYWFGYVLSQAGINDVDLSVADLPQKAYAMKGFEYLQKAYELDKNFARFLIGQSSPYKQFFDIYVFYYEKGIGLHNEQKYEEAVESYEDAMKASTFLSSNNMGVPAFDTNLIYYATLSYVNAKQEEKAGKHIEQLVKAGAKKEESIDLLKWQMNNALKANNKEEYDKVKAMAIQYYPKLTESLWNLYDVEYALSTAESYADKIKVYEKVLLTDKIRNARHAHNYVIEVYKENSSMSALSALSDSQAENMFGNMDKISALSYELNKEAYEPLYLYQRLFYRYASTKNDKVSKLKKELRDKAAPVKGVAPKGSPLEKELNRLKKAVASQRADTKTWAKRGLPVSEKLVAHFQALAPIEGKTKRAYGDILDIASGLAYLAGEGDKSDKYDRMRTKLMGN